MKFVLFIVALFVFHEVSAQMEEEISSLKSNVRYSKAPIYNLGSFSYDQLQPIIVLDDSVIIDKPKVMFYLTVAVSDTGWIGKSGGGQNNLLWTDDVITKKVDNQTHFLIIVVWNFTNYERISSSDSSRYFLGTFFATLYDKADERASKGVHVQLYKGKSNFFERK